MRQINGKFNRENYCGDEANGKRRHQDLVMAAAKVDIARLFRLNDFAFFAVLLLVSDIFSFLRPAPSLSNTASRGKHTKLNNQNS